MESNQDKTMSIDIKIDSAPSVSVAGNTENIELCETSVRVENGIPHYNLNNMRLEQGEECTISISAPVIYYCYTNAIIDGKFIFSGSTNTVVLVRTKVQGGTIVMKKKPYPLLPSSLFIDEFCQIENATFMGFDQIIHFSGDFETALSSASANDSMNDIDEA